MKSIFDIEAPVEFLCPITKKLMKDPLVSKYGNSFERSAILNWINEGNNCCPATRMPLSASNLVPNKKLQLRIQSWLRQNGHENVTVETKSKQNISAWLVVAPDDFLCPLSMVVMCNPVMTREGQNFEKDAIMTWLEKNDTCPVTGNILYLNDLVTNHRLQHEIKHWQKRVASEPSSLLKLIQLNEESANNLYGEKTKIAICDESSFPPAKSYQKADCRSDNTNYADLCVPPITELSWGYRSPATADHCLNTAALTIDDALAVVSNGTQS